MEFIENRRVQVGGITALLLSIVILFGFKGEYGQPIAASVPTLTSLLTNFLIGMSIAGLYFVMRHLFSRYGKWALLGITIFLILIGDGSRESSGVAIVTSSITGIMGFATGIIIVAYLFNKATFKIIPKTVLPNVFGTSRWATRDDLKEWELLGDKEAGNGLFLGLTHDKQEDAVIYDGDMHALTVAPTRRGKGATAIIPNLLRSNSSILVIDPKGENARRTVAKRIELGQQVYMVDPWAVSCEADKYGDGVDAKYLAGFNPLDFLKADDPDLTSDAMLLADALIIPAGKDTFWSDEAKAVIQGIILHVVTDPDEAENRHLGRVRDILSLPRKNPDDDDLDGTLDEILLKMTVSDNLAIEGAAQRILQKHGKELSSIMSTAQSNTHFLDSPKIRESLKQSDFQFKDLKTSDKGITVYLTLPLDRIPTFHRLLRLMVTSALIDLTRTPIQHDKPPVRVILDEFASLKKLELIETAYGTMAGLGVQLWILTQDLGQLMRLYGDKAWQTFVSNAGVFQYFGSRDYETAKYAEHLCGMTTMKKRSFSFGKNMGYRFRLHRNDLPGKPDICLPKYKTIIFVHGCFWHHHDCRKGTIPSSNREFWRLKIKKNINRDLENQKQLIDLGWKVKTVWECELKDSAVLYKKLQNLDKKQNI